VRLRRQFGYWGRQARPIRHLLFLVKRIVKFHESEPLLNATDKK
jgi:hypothetical protein